MLSSEKIEKVVWNITPICLWDCDFCVMDSSINCTRKELSYEQKLTAIKNLDVVQKVDLSGGEVFMNREDHMRIIPIISEMIGKENLGISCSGAYINAEIARKLSQYVSDIELTLDAHPDYNFIHRPKGYHKTAARASRYLIGLYIIS